MQLKLRRNQSDRTPIKSVQDESRIPPEVILLRAPSRSQKYGVFAVNFLTNLTLRSTLTPGTPTGVVMIATVVSESTSVAIKPPCRVPIMLVCSASTVISQRHWPALAEIRFTWKESVNSLFFFFFFSCMARTKYYRFPDWILSSDLIHFHHPRDAIWWFKDTGHYR